MPSCSTARGTPGLLVHSTGFWQATARAALGLGNLVNHATSRSGRRTARGIEGRLTAWFFATDEGDIAQGISPPHESPLGVSLAAVLTLSL